MISNKNKLIKVGIVGGAGYTGGELIRILINHPGADIVFVNSKSNSGKFLHEVHEDLEGVTELRFSDSLDDYVDVLFLCVGHGEAKKLLESASISREVVVIDLSQDYRLLHNGKAQTLNGRPFTYGLPELNREAIKTASHIANPGCFATAIQLALLPLAKEGRLKEVNTTGITGSTGAGQSLSSTSHFSWRANNIQSYKTLSHQHVKEVIQSLNQLQPSGEIGLHFIPWRGDFTRGIFSSSILDSDEKLEHLQELYDVFYQEHPFTIVSRKPIFLKQVVNTNKCMIQLEKIGTKLIIHSTIDNLVKGASGQAVQNMNIRFGLDEGTGLKLKANYF